MNPSDEQPGPSWWPDDGTPYTPSKPRRSRSISNDNKTSKKSRSPSSKRNTLSSKRDLVTESTTISSTCNTPSTENRKGPRMSRPLKRERGGNLHTYLYICFNLSSKIILIFSYLTALLFFAIHNHFYGNLTTVEIFIICFGQTF